MENKYTITQPQSKMLDKTDFIKNALEKLTSKRVMYVGVTILGFILLSQILKGVGNTIRALKDC